MKTLEDLNDLREEVKTLNRKPAELTGKKLDQVVGGQYKDYDNLDYQGSGNYEDPGISASITEHLGYCSYCKNWTYDYSKNRCQICGDPTAVGGW